MSNINFYQFKYTQFQVIKNDTLLGMLMCCAYLKIQFINQWVNNIENPTPANNTKGNP